MSSKFFTNTSERSMFDKFKGIIEHMKDLYAFHAVVGYFRSSGYFALQPCLKDLKEIGSVKYSINIPADNPGGQKSNPSRLGEVVEKMESWFDVYPNPTDGQLTVQLSGVREGDFRVVVVDMSGRTIFEDDKAAFHNGIFRINTSGFTPGIYFIQLTDSQGKASLRKFVKAD